MNFALFDKNKQMSLKFRIISLSLGMVGFLGIISFFILEGILNFSKEEKSRALQGYAVGFANQIAAQFYERYGDVQAFAANPVFRSGSRSEMQDSLNTMVKLYGIYDLVLVVDKDGRYISSNNVKPDGSELNVSSLEKNNYSNETWFKSVMSNNFTAQKSKAFDGTFVEQPMWDHLVSEVYKSDGLGNSFSAPKKNSRGETVAVITNRANWKWVENELLLLSKNMVQLKR